MKKYILLFILLLIPVNVFAVDLVKTNSKSVMVYDLTEDKLLYDRNGEEERQIASLTKIMTAILAIEKIEGDRTKYDFKQKVTITKQMLSNYQWDASVAGLKVGDMVTYEDLLYGTILPSGADAAQALAYSLSGSRENFVKEMNEKAKAIGLKHTKFVNVHGLDKYEKTKPYSTAEDVLTLLKYAMKNEYFKNVFTHKYWNMSNGLEVYTTLNFYSQKYGYDVSGIVGSKTGMTDLAGTCITGYFISNGHFYLYVSLGATYSQTAGYHILDLLNVKNFLNENYNELTLSEKDKEIKTIKVYYSKTKLISIRTKKEIKKYLPIDYDKKDYKITYEGIDEIKANKVPDKEKPIGTIKYTYKDELLDSEEVYLKEDIKFDLKEFIKEDENIVLHAGIAILALVLILIILMLILKKIFGKKNKKRKK